jgi:hypothetical protein
MIFAPRNATVIEFAMKPHSNRCFGYMAMALGMDYWLVPQISAFYHLRYTANNSNVAAVVNLLRHVLKLNKSSNENQDEIPSVNDPTTKTSSFASNSNSANSLKGEKIHMIERKIESIRQV